MKMGECDYLFSIFIILCNIVELIQKLHCVTNLHFFITLIKLSSFTIGLRNITEQILIFLLCLQKLIR